MAASIPTRIASTHGGPKIRPEVPTASVDPALPGADLVSQGLTDLTAGALTAEALLVQIGAPRLRALGIDVPRAGSTAVETTTPEMSLYKLLAADDPDAAHSRYNALVRALVSFERAAESAVR